ncbi:hypothetical protein TanjilG_24793 [Lupinus angustifolius]|uniref:BHLH domain-containing protein n=1 Tax=Lupinus angustifolius TaxID=3871 RepID=A0A4P1RKR3_LUPAN|nr:PREDICTED: transcription factor bHLH139-like [Lupinus angustifolius]OIW12860.1 hypothetical protein TanjilG_24793 [Lupinus angustifolius]
MESTQMISEEWCSLSGLNIAEEADFMTQLLGGNSTLGPDHESPDTNNTNSYFPSNVANTNFFYFSQGGSSSSADSGNIFSTTSSGTCSFDPTSNFDSMPMDICLGDSNFSPHILQWNDNLSQQINALSSDEEPGLDQGKPVLNDYNFHAEEDKNRNLVNSEKRSRRSIEEVSENMMNAKSRKIPKSASMSSFNEEDRISIGLQRQGSRSCVSEGDSDPSLEINGGESPSLSPKDPTPPNCNRKSRSTTSPATDPQTLYARKRRERINERLRILQSLVPNGTKVDISTMLEEAVQYVKFLQHQIKLLSSDDLWMYAPIAYNGVNIGLDFITTKGL